MSPGIKFSGKAFTKSLLGRRAKRWLKKAFDSIGGEQNILFLIENDRLLVEYLPPAKQYEIKKQFRERYIDYLKFLSDEDVYSWLPDDYRGLIESHPNGIKWAYKQIAFIRDYLSTS